MNHRLFVAAALLSCSLPLVACAADDDDAVAANPLAGHTYVLTTTKRDWWQPQGIGGDLENVMPHFLFQVTSAGGNNVTVRVSVAPKVKDAEGNVTPQIEQDPCSPTYDVTLSGAVAQIGPTDVPVHLMNAVDVDSPSDDLQVTATVVGLEFTNLFPPKGVWTQEDIDKDDFTGALRATMDFRELAPLFNVLYYEGMPPTTEAICDTLPDTAMCEPCGDGSVTCLTAEARFIHADDRPGMTIEPVDLATRPESW